MKSESLEKLVSDTLYCRRKIPNTCFLTNLAAQELKEQSADALPVIEAILKRELLPQISAIARRARPFLGLEHLVGAYMVIASRHDASRAVEFLHSLPVALQATAVALIPLFFRKEECRPIEKAGNDPKPIPDERLLSFIEEAARSNDTRLREYAASAISFYPSLANRDKRNQGTGHGE